MKPLVSILIPAYESQEWLADTLESAVAQTWPSTEIIVVDDGSRDQTLQVARRFESKNVLVMSQPNQGAAAARNTAFSLCQGDYVQWLDADDLLEPGKIAAQVAAMRDAPSPRTLLSGAWGSFMYRTRTATFSASPLWSNLTPVEWLVRKMGQNLHMQTDNWLVSRELSLAAGPWDTRLWRDNDGEYFARVLLASDGVHFVPHARSYYRQAGYRSISYIGRSNKKIESLFLSMTLHMQYLRSLEDSERTRGACISYIQTWLHEFYPDRRDLGDRLQAMAIELGGRVEPRLSSKYHWITRVLGWSAARHAQLALPRVKATARIAWDRALFRLESRKAQARASLLAGF